MRELPCQILDPIPLGEGAGVGLLKGVDSKEISEGSTLYDLVQMGINQMHTSVGVVVRLRKELSLVKDIPVLIAIDQVSTSSSSFIYLYLYLLKGRGPKLIFYHPFFPGGIFNFLNSFFFFFLFFFGSNFLSSVF